MSKDTITPSSSLIQKAAVYISNLMKSELSPALTFHNLTHTQEVATAAETIAQHEQLSAEETEIVILAAWFHDVGQIVCYKGHELSSQNIARYFLLENNCPIKKISQILACINATRMPQNPSNKLEKIMCDADLSHLAMPPEIYMEHLKRLKKEWKKVLGQNQKKEDWLLTNIDFLSQHHYFTNYGKTIMQSKKELNISHLMELL